MALELRGTGYSAPHPDQERDMLRAGALTGATPVMLLIDDLHSVMSTLRELPFLKKNRIFLYGKSDAGIACVYHSLFDDGIAGMVVEDLPSTHRKGGYILGILRVLDLDNAVGLLAPRPVFLLNQKPGRSTWAKRAYQRLGCEDRLVSGAYSLESVLQRLRTY